MQNLVSADKNPLEKKPVSDASGHYDMDGVTQTPNFQVIVAGDKVLKNENPSHSNTSRIKLRFQRWLAAWDDESL